MFLRACRTITGQKHETQATNYRYGGTRLELHGSLAGSVIPIATTGAAEETEIPPAVNERTSNKQPTLLQPMPEPGKHGNGRQAADWGRTRNEYSTRTANPAQRRLKDHSPYSLTRAARHGSALQQIIVHSFMTR